ncbi:unnamed protein product [Rotaria sp. Silwood1]|nr:unnamed protein product [Rotaria sp. Silwood1]
MKQWLGRCQAQGGGDTPEAVADALHDVLTLSWRPEATKICILISDAPPHGLNSYDDTFPNGCPLGFDPIKIVQEMAEKHITLYTVGVEPFILPYRDFFMSLAYSTGGQYVPLVDATLLAQVIIGGVREEISLDRLMKDAHQDIAKEIKQAEQDGINEREMTMRINHILTSKNKRVKQMHNTFGVTSYLVEEYYSKCVDMHQMKSIYKMTKTTQENKMDEISYVLKEDNVTVEQTKRLIQKVKNRKLVKSTTIKPNVDETITEKQTKKNKRNNQRQDYDNSRLRKRRLKDGAIDVLINAEDNYQEDQKEGILHDDDIMKTKQLQDQVENPLDKQFVAEKQAEKIKTKRRKQISSADVDVPKQKTIKKPRRKSNNISDYAKVPDDIHKPVFLTDTINHNSTNQEKLHTEQMLLPTHPFVRSNNNIFYLIVSAVLTVIISVYFFFFK